MCDKMKCFENYDYKFISNMIENKVYKLPCGLIPMCEVVNKLNININYLQNITRMDLK